MRRGQKIFCLIDGEWKRGLITKIVSRSEVYVACEGPPNIIFGKKYTGTRYAWHMHKRKNIRIVTKKKERKWIEYY